MLCHFSQFFPAFVSNMLDRDRHLRKNFREETITDILMGALVGLSSHGIFVDFPDEVATGADMEWVFVSMNSKGRGKILRLLIQAKRAIHSPAYGGYHYYNHLDYGTPKGSQARTLVATARRHPGTTPLYILYHESSATNGVGIIGVNMMFATPVSAEAWSGRTRNKKKISYWSSLFFKMSDIFCPSLGSIHAPPTSAPPRIDLMISPNGPRLFFVGKNGPTDPENVALSLNAIRAEIAESDTMQDREAHIPDVETSSEIPDEIIRAVRGEQTDDDIRKLTTPRAIFLNLSD